MRLDGRSAAVGEGGNRAGGRAVTVAITLAVVVSVVSVAAIGATPAAAQSADGDRPVVRVESVGSLGVNETTTVSVVATSLPDGFSGTDFNVTVADPSTARIVGTSATAGAYGESSVDGDWKAVLRMVDFRRAVQPGATNVRLARVTVEGVSNGTTSLAVEDLNLDVEDGGPFDPTATVDGSVRVGTSGLEPVGGNWSVPTDPDGDGRFEDLSGDGTVGYGDVVILHAAFEDPAVVGQADAYDFNDNGRLDFGDVIALFGAR